MILFEKVTWKNFLSTGNDGITIDLNQHQLLLFVGRNGAGKSTLLDALCFALYGKAFRNINKPQLPNTINKKDCVAEVWFTIGSNKYHVKRGINPALFEISVNDKLVDQAAASKDYQKTFEKDILKLTYQAFIQIVTLGVASFTPFMQLPTGERRALIDTLLDVQVFTNMGAILKSKITINDEELFKLQHHIDLLEQKLKYLRKHDTTVKANKEERIKGISEKIKTNLETLSSQNEFRNRYETDINTLVSQLVDQSKLQEEHRDATLDESQVQEDISRIKEELRFYKTNSTCPKCKQSISEGRKNTVKHECDLKEQIFQKSLSQIREVLSRTKSTLEAYSQITQNLTTTRNKLLEVNVSVGLHTNAVRALEKEIQEIEKEKEVKVDGEAIREGIEILAKFNKKKDELTNERFIYGLASTLLKDDGIKTTIVKRYIPIINKFVNKYLASMDFFVNFELDESFKEKIMSRYRDEFSYASFSEGEKLRIDLALLFTWRSIAKLRNSASTNLLIIDEIFESSLDGPGLDDFVKLLNTFSEGLNIIIISPKGDALFDKFENVIRFEKHQNFTRIK